MPKKFNDEPEAPKKLASYTVKLDDAQMDKLRASLEARGWTPFEVAYTRFAFKADHLKVSGIKTKVCTVAAQASKMEAQARAQAQNGGGGGLLGGPGLTGSLKMPQGAL